MKNIKCYFETTKKPNTFNNEIKFIKKKYFLIIWKLGHTYYNKIHINIIIKY